jgi:hypothetical protein
MRIEMTMQEERLLKLIDEIEESTSDFSAQRDKELLYALQMVLTLSNDNCLPRLIEFINKEFPAYGKAII